jgi:uncharacterized membrane protein (DUF485 family)
MSRQSRFGPAFASSALATAPTTTSVEGEIMESSGGVDWDAVVSDQRFQSLRQRKQRVLWGLMAFSVAYFLLLPLGAAYYQDLFKVRVWGVVNVGLLCALSEFVVVWAIAIVYSRKATQDFDRAAESLAAQFTRSATTPTATREEQPA